MTACGGACQAEAVTKQWSFTGVGTLKRIKEKNKYELNDILKFFVIISLNVQDPQRSFLYLCSEYNPLGLGVLAFSLSESLSLSYVCNVFLIALSLQCIHLNIIIRHNILSNYCVPKVMSCEMSLQRYSILILRNMWICSCTW